jgi:hypothetical protein
MMHIVYRNNVQNINTHLDVGIINDTVWQDHWCWLVVFTSQLCLLPKGNVDKQCILTLPNLLDFIQAHKWNSDRFVFLSGDISMQ